MKEELLKIIQHYGIMPQLKYFQSEVFELNEAIIDQQWVESDYGPTSIIQNKEHIAEEIADVQVMLNQFKEYYGITNREIEEVMKQKIERQLERINRGE